MSVKRASYIVIKIGIDNITACVFDKNSAINADMGRLMERKVAPSGGWISSRHSVPNLRCRQPLFHELVRVNP